MLVLVLNNMRDGNLELQTNVCWSDDKAELQQLLDQEQVYHSYSEPKDPNDPSGMHWGKRFRKGGVLEWFNPPIVELGQGIVEAAPKECWSEMAHKYGCDVNAIVNLYQAARRQLPHVRELLEKE